jgi:hypothetical protein
LSPLAAQDSVSSRQWPIPCTGKSEVRRPTGYGAVNGAFAKLLVHFGDARIDIERAEVRHLLIGVHALARRPTSIAQERITAARESFSKFDTTNRRSWSGYQISVIFTMEGVHFAGHGVLNHRVFPDLEPRSYSWQFRMLCLMHEDDEERIGWRSRPVSSVVFSLAI